MTCEQGAAVQSHRSIAQQPVSQVIARCEGRVSPQGVIRQDMHRKGVFSIHMLSDLYRKTRFSMHVGKYLHGERQNPMHIVGGRHG